MLININMIDEKKFIGFYRGIVIQNNDPSYAGRVKVFVPAVNANLLENWTNNFKNDETFNHVGSNVNGFSDEIILKLKKVLPWAGTCMPLIGMGSSGFYFSPAKQSTVANDSNQSGQEKKNLTQSCDDKQSQENFKQSASSEKKDLGKDPGPLNKVQATVYGYPSDPYIDSNSAKGIGNSNNKLSSNQSVALQKETADSLGLKKGESMVVTFPDGKQGIYKYDDTIPSNYSNHRMDFYMKSDQEKANFNYNGANIKVEKLNSTNKPPAQTPEDSSIITPPTYVDKPTCNQGGGGMASQSNNKQDTTNYTGNANIDNHAKTTFPSDSYRNPNDVRGTNNLKQDVTLQTRPFDHSNNWKGMISIPGIGAHVWIFFEDGNTQYPIVMGYHANQAAFLGVHGISDFPVEEQYFN